MSKRSQFRKFAKVHMTSDSSDYPKDRLVDIPSELWPTGRDNYDPKRFKVLRNRNFLVQLFNEKDDVVRVSVTKSQLGMGRTFADGISWDELQDIKRMCGYGNLMAVEVYPRDVDIINVANMRHLWVLPEILDIGWFSKEISE